MNENLSCAALFSTIPTLLLPLFEGCKYPWDALKGLKESVDSLIANPPKGYTLWKEGVLVGEGVEIHESAVILPPAVIGTKSEIRPGAFLRGYVFCGEGCVIGNATELKHCILMDKVQVPHYNYVGDSILGYKAHMGASAICSNLKSDGKNVVVHGESDLETGLRKLGGILGDHADVGCGCVINPGTVIGKESRTYPLTSLRGVYPARFIIKDTYDITPIK